MEVEVCDERVCDLKPKVMEGWGDEIHPGKQDDTDHHGHHREYEVPPNDDSLYDRYHDRHHVLLQYDLDGPYHKSPMNVRVRDAASGAWDDDSGRPSASGCHCLMVPPNDCGHYDGRVPSPHHASFGHVVCPRHSHDEADYNSLLENDVTVICVFLGVKKKKRTGTGTGQVNETTMMKYRVPFRGHDYHIYLVLEYRCHAQAYKGPVEDPRQGDDGRSLYYRRAANDLLFERHPFCVFGHGEA